MTEPLPLSLLNDYLYCARRAALKAVEGVRGENEHTVLGDLAHEHADLPGYEVAKGVLLWRALPVFSARLGLNGKCDIVEVAPVSADLKSPIANLKSLVPVEFKVGRRRQFENDDVQLCAQALCLEEMFGVTVTRGAVFHAQSKRRREVALTPELRKATAAAAAALHALVEQFESSGSAGQIPPLPPAVFKPACAECSLYAVCLPQATSRPPRLAQLTRQLFAA